MASDPDIDAPSAWPHHRAQQAYPRSPSAVSTISSTSSSAFSIDAPSSQSSVASAPVGWSGPAWHGQRFLKRRDSQSSEESWAASGRPCQTSLVSKTNDVVSLASRQHRRRTQRLDTCKGQDGRPVNQCPRLPPPLVRQCERKDDILESLVDTATQMIETIWPLSVLSCDRDTALGAKQQNPIGLRTFVTEMLRRSKPSHSTLQVALYYLILIQASLPKQDFTMGQPEDSLAYRAMQCGRRMFLSALILASKYLQDRNFSARAWGKISGLRTCEINTNELAFLAAVNWKLHIPEPIFHRWTDIVLKSSPSANVNGPLRSLPPSLRWWKSLVPVLTPELDNLDDLDLMDSSYDSGYDSPSRPPMLMHEVVRVSSSKGSGEPTPTNPYTIPRVLEPTPRETRLEAPILPQLPRLGLLPTLQLTSRTGGPCTPAVSASGFCRESFLLFSRRSSVAALASSMSSPESVMSDRSSRPSRSSSISSIASSNCALPLPRLALQATRRCATMQLCDLKEGEVTPQAHGFLHSTTSSDTMRAPAPMCQGVTASTHEAASALRDLALNRQAANVSPARSLKRSRTDSMDLPVHSSVRQSLLRRNTDDSSRVLPDEKMANSFTLQKENAPSLRSFDSLLLPTPLPSYEESPRKRACAGNGRGERPAMHGRSVTVCRPGMWEGVL